MFYGTKNPRNWIALLDVGDKITGKIILHTISLWSSTWTRKKSEFCVNQLLMLSTLFLKTENFLITLFTIYFSIFKLLIKKNCFIDNQLTWIFVCIIQNLINWKLKKILQNWFSGSRGLTCYSLFRDHIFLNKK